jgi:hypothetical protein
VIHAHSFVLFRKRHRSKQQLIHESPESQTKSLSSANFNSLILAPCRQLYQTTNKSDRNKLLLGIRGGTGPGLKLEKVRVVKVQTLVYTISLTLIPYSLFEVL